jgi:hypothetical protein
VRALAKAFRGRFCAGLEQLQAEGQLQFHGALQPLAQPKAFKGLLRQAIRHKWVVYAKRPFAGPKEVLGYLARYTHRVAISPRRLLALEEQKQTVTFAWKDYAEQAKRKTMTLGLQEFVRRFCLHLLPERFVKIRHFGFLSNRQRKLRVGQARALLNQSSAPATTALAQLEPEPARVCPHCESPRLVLIEIVQPWVAPPPRPLDSS